MPKIEASRRRLVSAFEHDFDVRSLSLADVANAGLPKSCFIPLGPTVAGEPQFRSGRQAATAAALALAAYWASVRWASPKVGQPHHLRAVRC